LLAQQDDLPSTIEEHSPSLPQQPFSPVFVEHFIPAAEHLQPSFVPPVSSEALALALTMFSSALVVSVEAALLAALALPLPALLFLTLELSAVQPASPSTINASSAASFIFINFLLRCGLKARASFT
jgi:hypothetical protein